LNLNTFQIILVQDKREKTLAANLAAASSVSDARLRLKQKEEDMKRLMAASTGSNTDKGQGSKEASSSSPSTGHTEKTTSKSSEQGETDKTKSPSANVSMPGGSNVDKSGKSPHDKSEAISISIIPN